MTLLLDTHLLIWATEDSPRLSAEAVALMRDPSNKVTLSVVNLWEIVIKQGLGRSDFAVDARQLRTRVLKTGLNELTVTAEHALAVTTLPSHHKDPFDRLLVAQASVEGFTLLTSDPVVAKYPGRILKV